MHELPFASVTKGLLPRTRKAFTLVETLIAITVASLVLTAVTGLILLTMRTSNRNLHTVQALAYAQEGIEVMRFFRDSNVLQNYEWWGLSQGSVGGSGFSVKPGEKPLTLFIQEDAPWRFGGDGRLENNKGFPFTRHIEVSAVDEDTIEVSSVVIFEELGKERQVKLSTYLTDWQ